MFLRTVAVPGGKAAQLGFTYTVPGAVQTLGNSKVYRLTVRHQPMVNPVDLKVTVTLPEGTSVRTAPGWTVKGNVLSFEASLTQDLSREIQF